MKKPLFIPLITLLITILPLCFSSNLDWFDSCGNYFSCGNVTQVGFPFWGSGSRPKDCGYPGFELGCETNSTITIGIMGMKYRVLDINQNTKIVTVSREDFWEGNCLQRFVNTTLDFDLFEYAPGSQNVTVLYGCPPPYSEIKGQFKCKVNGVNETDAYPELGALGPSGCNDSVVVPVMESLAEKMGNWSLNQVIKYGFKVKYKVQNELLCAQCEGSRGRCGFDLNKNLTNCLCPDGSVGYSKCNVNNKTAILVKDPHKPIVIGVVAGGIGLALALFVCASIFIVQRRKRVFSQPKDNIVLEVSQPKTKQEVEAILRNCGITDPKRYTYKELKGITNSFKDTLGEGGYGTVYKGRLHNGNLVAVKILKKPKGDPMEFINEVASTGTTKHKNIVALVGFCYESHRRALVYDFMPNGSLEKFVYDMNNDQSLAWEKLFQIAVGIARGLEYLHQGCNTRILHFDIKPHNILLDENFCPKISDFGLAKSCPQKESIMSMSGARGTVGYIAPEVFLRSFGGVSQKSDVYSYGMLVLEMVGSRKKPDPKVECGSEDYFPDWIYRQLEQQDYLETLNDEDRQSWRKMVLVSLCCTQLSPQSRPTMTRVVEMLEGTTESLQVPPIRTLASPPRSISLLQDSSNSQTISIS